MVEYSPTSVQNVHSPSHCLYPSPTAGVTLKNTGFGPEVSKTRMREDPWNSIESSSRQRVFSLSGSCCLQVSKILDTHRRALVLWRSASALRKLRPRNRLTVPNKPASSSCAAITSFFLEELSSIQQKTWHDGVATAEAPVIHQ